MEAATTTERTEFANETDGMVGYVRINVKTGEEIGDVVHPGESVWLTDDEIQATHRAPRDEKDSPFVGRELERTEEIPEDDGQGGTKVRTRTWTESLPPLLVKKQRGNAPVFRPQDEETGDIQAAPAGDGGQGQGEPPQGSYGPGEEQGTQT